jgi:hypothetical protein
LGLKIRLSKRCYRFCPFCETSQLRPRIFRIEEIDCFPGHNYVEGFLWKPSLSSLGAFRKMKTPRSKDL